MRALRRRPAKPRSKTQSEARKAPDSPVKADMVGFDLAIKKYGGSLRKQFLASGYTSVDQYINEIRGRNVKGELDVPGPYG